MVALQVAHLHRFDPRLDAPFAHDEPVGSVVVQRMPAPLRLQHQGEGGIAGDRDLRDMVHLDRDVEGHVVPLRLAHFALAGRRDERKPRLQSGNL